MRNLLIYLKVGKILVENLRKLYHHFLLIPKRYNYLNKYNKCIDIRTPSRSGSVVSLGIQFGKFNSLFEGTNDSGKKFKSDCIERPQSNIMVISRKVRMWHGLLGSLLKQYCNETHLIKKTP